MIQKGDEVQDLIAQLQQLQLQQNGLLARLESARRQETETVDNGNDSTRAAIVESDDRENDAEKVRPFSIGDRVIITNPNRALFQANRGVITRIGARITVETKNGKQQGHQGPEEHNP